MASIVGAMQVEMGLRHVLTPNPSPSAEGKSVRVALAPNPILECFSFAVSPECPLHEDRVGEVTKLKRRRSTDITVAELICATKGETQSNEGTLCLDWPIVVEAECRHCHRVWQPMMRKARFQSAGRCPSCDSNNIAEQDVLHSIDLPSRWASMTLTQVGLPAQHIHEVYWDGTADLKKYIEVSGDWDEE
jgi:predicted Zn-ribbon and HTH transcriptional regulator